MTGRALDASREAGPAVDPSQKARGLTADTATGQSRSGFAPVGSLSLSDEILATGLIGGLEPAELAKAFGTPFYAYDLDVVTARVQALRAILPARVRLAFAVKANPSLAVATHMAGLGLGADIASSGELELVIRAGFDAGRVVMTGPGKRDAELGAAVAAGIGAITVESPAELARLDSIAARAGRRVPILLRLAMDGEAGERVRLIGGGGGKFGMPLGELRQAAVRAARSRDLELLGVHAFGASNVLDGERLADHVAALVAVAEEVASEAGVALRLVDAGGGLGIPYADAEAPLDLGVLGERLTALQASWESDPRLGELSVLVEPGRFLVGPAGAYVAAVVDVKGPAEHPVAILEGGINHVVRPALVRQEHRLRLLARREAGTELVPVTVAGPLCTGIDLLAAGAPLPRPRPGDLVAVLDVGAYGFTESMPLFLSHATPAEVAIRGGRARLIRPRLSPSELLERQLVPDW